MDLDEKLKKNERLENKRSYYISEYIIRVLIIQKFILLPLAEKTNIKPNQVTITAGIFAFLSLVALYNHYAILAGILYLIYHFLDNIDGMLARYKNLSSKLGHLLDNIVDILSFNGAFIVAYLAYQVSIFSIFFVIFAMNLHAVICSQIIVKKLRTLKTVKRYGVKKFFLDRGFILGIDPTLLSILIILSFITECFTFFFYLIGLIYLFDLLYRSIELYRNLKENDV
ncbi:CDP-alcohol phosphatidyltransferase family protein [Campylobacter sp. B0100352/1]|uniref:CDP-alcohol phosphatidyltransferase family protein n=1 Tax=Campylobacter sp. B0100352/1 TaxID=2735783 RepID=UPI001D1C895B|nr:CDP-alcohol phosphatidyltransferase family protein [Campylobacter sp. B0100352/1]